MTPEQAVELIEVGNNLVSVSETLSVVILVGLFLHAIITS